MLKGVDYGTYDPANFAGDHPDNAVLLDARERAQLLAIDLKQAKPQGTPEERRQYLDHGFDELQSDHWDRTDLVNKEEDSNALARFREDRREEILSSAQERIERSSSAIGEIASWEGTRTQLERIDKMTMSEAREESTEFDESMKRLSQFQGARNEAASNEIEEQRNEVMRHHGLDQITPDQLEAVHDSQAASSANEEMPTPFPANENHRDEPRAQSQSAALDAYDRIVGHLPAQPAPNAPSTPQKSTDDYPD